MTVYNYPDMCWLRRSILMALLNHPYVENAEVYYPSDSATKKKVLIETGRLFGGIELIQPGLTLSVHPYHSSFDTKKGTPTSVLSSTTTKYSVDSKDNGVNIGSAESSDITYKACIRLVVQLYYRDGNYNSDLNLKGEVINQRSLTNNTQFGYAFQYSDLLPEGAKNLSDRSNKQIESILCKVQILPAEEILTQWLDILKYAVRDLKVLLPYTEVRNIVVTHSDYPTTTWTASNPNLIFHTAYHIIELEVYEAAPVPRFVFPPIQDINISVVQ